MRDYHFQKTDTNVTGPVWVGYRLQLFDDFPAPDQPQSDEHPPQPHFHPRTATFIFGETFTGADTTKYFGSFQDVAQRNPSDLLLLGGHGKEVAQNQSVQIMNLLIHEREFAIGTIPDPGRRIFRLVETPLVTPEPSSLWLCGLGLVSIGSYARLKRWRRGISPINCG